MTQPLPSTATLSPDGLLTIPGIPDGNAVGVYDAQNRLIGVWNPAVVQTDSAGTPVDAYTKAQADGRFGILAIQQQHTAQLNGLLPNVLRWDLEKTYTVTTNATVSLPYIGGATFAVSVTGGTAPSVQLDIDYISQQQPKNGDYVGVRLLVDATADLTINAGTFAGFNGTTRKKFIIPKGDQRQYCFRAYLPNPGSTQGAYWVVSADHAYYPADFLIAGSPAGSLDTVLQWLAGRTSGTTPANQAPSVTINGNNTGTAGTQQSFQAVPSDSDGTIGKVELLLMADASTLTNFTVLDTDTVSPYVLNWTPQNAGNFNLRTRATDNQGATAFSSVLAVQVAAATKSGFNIISLGDSRVAYEGDTGTPATTSVPALTTARLATANRTETVLNRGYPGRTSEWALSDTSAEGYKVAGQTAVQEVISQFKSDKYNIVLVGFGANGNSTVDAMRQVHQALKAGGADYTIATPILNRLDAPTWANGIQDRATKNAAIIASKGVWSSEVSRTDGVPQIYADDAPNNATYFWMNDKVGLSKVHLTTEGNKLQAEQDAQALSRIMGFVLPAMEASAQPIVSQTIEQDDARLVYAPANSWTSYSYNPQYSGTYGAASNAADAKVTLTIAFYGVRFRTPRSNVASTVKLVVKDTSGQVLDTITGTQYSASPPQNADPLTTIVQKVYATAPIRTLEFSRGTDANLSGTALLFDVLEFSDAAGNFPSAASPYLDFGGLVGASYNSTTYVLRDIVNAQDWASSRAYGKLLAQDTAGATEKARLKTSFTVNPNGGTVIVGLTATGDTAADWQDVQYGIYATGGGAWGITEKGTFKAGIYPGGTLAANSTHTLEIVVTSVVKYYLDGVEQSYVSTVAPVFPLLTKVLFEVGGMLTNTQIIAGTTSLSAFQS